MNNKEAIKLFRFYQGEIICDKEMKQALDLAIKALEDRPTVCGNNQKWCESCVSKGKCASTRPTGEWIFIDNEVGWDKCSNCNWTDARCHNWNFCPNCGADMRGGKE